MFPGGLAKRARSIKHTRWLSGLCTPGGHCVASRRLGSLTRIATAEVGGLLVPAVEFANERELEPIRPTIDQSSSTTTCAQTRGLGTRSFGPVQNSIGGRKGALHDEARLRFRRNRGGHLAPRERLGLGPQAAARCRAKCSFDPDRCVSKTFGCDNDPARYGVGAALLRIVAYQERRLTAFELADPIVKVPARHRGRHPTSSRRWEIVRVFCPASLPSSDQWLRGEIFAVLEVWIGPSAVFSFPGSIAQRGVVRAATLFQGERRRCPGPSPGKTRFANCGRPIETKQDGDPAPWFCGSIAASIGDAFSNSTGGDWRQ